MGQAWSGTANRAVKEGINYGKQTGDKYALGFIGVLENGGSVSDLKFTNCKVVFNYNWNCSAAIAVGAIVTTGEDYSYNHDGQHIVGVQNGYAVYGNGTPVNYMAKGPKWTLDNNSIINDAEYTDDINYRAYKGWVTEVKNIETDNTCYVECSGRPGGIIGSVGGRYNAGKPNNDFMDGNYKTWLTNAAKAAGIVDKDGKGVPKTLDGYSIFCTFGTLNIDGCKNGATVVHNFQKNDYSQAAGIAAYFIAKAGDGTYSYNITNCSNSGSINSSTAAQIFCINGVKQDSKTKVWSYSTKVNTSGNTGTGVLKCEGIAIRPDGKIAHADDQHVVGNSTVAPLQ